MAGSGGSLSVRLRIADTFKRTSPSGSVAIFAALGQVL